MYDSSLSVLYVWSCAHFPQTKHVKRADLLELSFWSSLSVLWLNELWWEGWGGGEQLRMWAVYVAQEANFFCSLFNSLDSRLHTSMQKPSNNSHISSVVLVESVCVCGGGRGVYRKGTETGFCSIMHDNKSQRPMVYCGKLLRLWPKWFGHKEKFWVPAGPNLKNAAWQSINSLPRRESSLLAEEL